MTQHRSGQTVWRGLAAVLALVLIGNGLAMLAAGPWWYGAVPGVTETGPYNAHFINDIGAAYLVCGIALASLAARPSSTRAWGAAAVGAAFLVLHAAIHVADELSGRHAVAEFGRDFAGVFLPALIGAALIWAARPLRKEA